MAATFFFYDLETSGFSPREARIMQFAGQRTDAELNPVGEPVNVLIKLAADVLPDPDAVLLTGITPQQTLAEGLTEAEFLKFFYSDVVQPETTFLGFNTVRFDDEFMRFLHYRNFYDAYEWQWCDDCSRWDILDLVRLTRALKPEGIEWPFTEEGKPTNRLELLTKLNKLEHAHAHDALSDVSATIAVAELIRSKQPELFKYLFDCRGKAEVRKVLGGSDDGGKVFTYTSGRYPAETLHTTAVTLLGEDEARASALVYDLRHDPTPYLDMSVAEIVKAWSYDPERPKDAPRFPVKTLRYNRCPAIVPGYPKDTAAQERLQLTQETVTKHLGILNRQRQTFLTKLRQAVIEMDEAREQHRQEADESPVDHQLYDDFFSREDKAVMRQAVRTQPDELGNFVTKFRDQRLIQLLPLYKARNYPGSLNQEERAAWEAYLADRLYRGEEQGRLGRYFARLQELAKGDLTSEQKYLLEELQLYGQSLMPAYAG